MKRIICVLIAVFTLLPTGASFAGNSREIEAEQALKAYFDMKYEILSSLTYDPKIEKLLDPFTLSSPDALSEADVLSTTVKYRKAQLNDLRYDRYKYSLQFENVRIDSNKATAIFTEDYELYFKCAPTVRSKASVAHIALLEKRDGGWLLVKDDYTDPDGIKQLLNSLFLSSGIDKAEASGMALAKLNSQAETRLEKLNALMGAEGAGRLAVFCTGKNAAYIAGKACRIDDKAGIVPTGSGETALLPVRFTLEKLGATVTWDKATSTVNITCREHEASFRQGGDSVLLDGAALPLKTPAAALGGRMMLPADILAKISDLSVYADENGIVLLSDGDTGGGSVKELAAKLGDFFAVLFTKADFPHIDGSTATYPLSMEIGKELLGLDDTGVKGFITHNTTHNAYVNLINGNADIIFVTQPSPEELALAAGEGVELEAVPICSEGFVFLANSGNPVKNLTAAQVRDIYKGVIKNWKEVGGEDREIIPYQREANSGSQTIMENTVMKGIAMAAPPKEVLVYGMGELIDRVADYSNSRDALGYSVFYYATTMYRNRAVKLLSIDGVEPSVQTIRDGSYPFVINYYAVLRKSEDEDGGARRLLGWLLGEEGQSLAEKAGFVPLK
jgi:phosphate transport system substrate-binding protein